MSQELYARLEEQNGREHQILVAIEELSELQKELTKHLRNDSYTNNKKITEEIADVEICIDQLKRFFDQDNQLVQFIKDYKLKRLEFCYLDSPTFIGTCRSCGARINNNEIYITDKYFVAKSKDHSSSTAEQVECYFCSEECHAAYKMND